MKNHQCPVESPLLDGHLSLTVELLAFRSVNERYYIGSHPNGQQLIKVLYRTSNNMAVCYLFVCLFACLPTSEVDFGLPVPCI